MNALAVSPLSLHQFTRAYWGRFDSVAIARLARLADDPCYQVKFYKAPADNQEVLPALGYVAYGMRVTPGSVIFGFYLPAVVNVAAPADSAPGAYTVQITDVSLERKWFDEPVGSVFLSNFNPVYQSNVATYMGSFPNLLTAPYPVVGSGEFDIEIQETSGAPQRIELVLGVLEVC